MVLDTRWNRWFVIPIIHEVAMFHVFLVLRDVVITKKIAKNHWTSSRLQIKCGSWRSCVGHFLKCKCWPWGHYCSRRHIGVKISDGSGTWNWFKPSWTYMGFFYKKKKFLNSFCNTFWWFFIIPQQHLLRCTCVLHILKSHQILVQKWRKT